MFTNVNLAAPVGALALLGTAALFFLLGVAFLYSLIRKKTVITRFTVIAGAILGVLYLSTLLIFSARSSEKLLTRGQEKHFCEIDCHLAYSVGDVQQTKVLGTEPNLVTASGMFRVVTINTRFDPNTISPTRGDGTLRPNSRVVSVTDENGKQYFPSPEGQRALEASNATGKPFNTSLRPGETYATVIAFDLPADVRNPVLLIREGEPFTHFLIGHENSFWHKKTRFQI